MAGDKVKAPARGETFYGPQQTIDTNNYGNAVGVEGLIGVFRDIDPTVTYGATQPRSSGEVTCLFCRNVGPATVNAKELVIWAAGYRGKRFAGKAFVDWAEAAGVVDEYLDSNGCRVGDMCWLAVAGPSLVKNALAADATTVIAEGDILAALTAATSGATTAGRVQAFAATSNLTNAVSAIVNRVGRAMSAKTTNQTNANVLAYLEMWK